MLLLFLLSVGFKIKRQVRDVFRVKMGFALKLQRVGYLSFSFVM